MSGPQDTDRNARRIPRSAWWVAGIALAMVSVLVFARPSWFSQTPDQDELAVSGDRHFTKSLAALGNQDGIWLTSDVTSTVFTVPLPVDSGHRAPRLRLSGSTQVAQDSTVFLMVYFDGKQVYEEQLARGDNRLDRAIDIPSQAAEDGRVRVQVRTRGALDEQHCTNDPAAGMVVHLEPTTVVEAALAEPVHTVRDAVAALDRRVTLIVTETGPEWFATAALLGMSLTQAGHDVVYTDAIPIGDNGSGFSSWVAVGPDRSLSDRLGWTAGDDDALDASIRVGRLGDRAALAIVKPEPVAVAHFLTSSALVTGDGPASDPVALVTATSPAATVGLADLGVDVSQAQIAESRSWPAAYSLADLPGGRLPKALRVGLRLPASSEDITWILNVSLNGELIASRRLEALTDTVEVPIPPESQRLRNDLKVTVQRDRTTGGCTVRTTTYPIQLTSESALVLGDDPGAGFTALPQKFAGGLDVRLPADADPPAVLTAAVPVLSDFVGRDAYPKLQWHNGIEDIRGAFVAITTDEGARTEAPIGIVDGRLTSGHPATLDLTPFRDGTLIQCAGAAGLSVNVKGDPGALATPSLGRECVRLVTAGGSFALSSSGEVIAGTPPQTGTPQ